jgi:hypothetical protein
MGLPMIKPSFLICVLAATLVGNGQTLHRKNAAAIAKEANGAVVSIVMSDKEGHPIAQGSGFLISKDGRVVTNYHVIKSGSSAVIKLPDGASFPVEGVLVSDKHRDVAIIKAHGSNFRMLILGDSARLQVGEEVVAIGSPLSLESTVSNGILSGIRTVEEEGGKFLQITAPISPGSSGGPLFNMVGEVVGITTSHLVGGENLNFAIPIDDVKHLTLMPRLAEARAFPDEANEARGDKKDPSPKIGQTTLTYKNTKPYRFKADCSVVGNVESCVIFNELAGNEDSDLFNSLLLYSDDSLACFTSPESIDNKFESKRFYVFLFNTHIEDPVVSLFETYDNGTLTGVQTFYLVPSLDYSFEVSETGDGDNGIRPLHGELSKDTFSWAQLVTQRSFDNWHYYSLDVSLATGRMTRVWGGKPTFGRCFWFDHQSIDAAKELSRPQWATKEAAEAIARDRSETAVKLKAQIAAGTDATAVFVTMCLFP